MIRLTVILLCTTYIFCENNNSSPRIIIIGAGAAGIGAASRLLQNGFENVTILEAENRIGGRVHSTKIGEYMIDLGGQWVHGEVDNVAFELAWPLGLLERSVDVFNDTLLLFTSTGVPLPNDTVSNFANMFNAISEQVSDSDNKYTNKSVGELVAAEFNKYFENHPEINENLRKGIVHYFDLTVLSSVSAETFYQLPFEPEIPYAMSAGDQAINWKERTYSTILDILMKKYPSPEEELPVLNNTLLNNKVMKINYQQTDDTVKVTTKNGREYTADHVIVTASLGVLKADHKELFEPSLSDTKINSIDKIGYGHEGKIFLYYNDPWWPIDDDVYTKGIVWTDEDRRQLEHDPERSWMLGVTYFFRVEHRPKLLAIWLSSKRSSSMERVPEDKFHNQIDELIDRFFGRTYKLTKPTAIMRTEWNTNENFRGTYSFRDFVSDIAKASPQQLAEPIVQNGKPIVQFAGEATDEHWASVHGAISSGWREADRLIDFYREK